jgi:HEAT repeat protein
MQLFDYSEGALSIKPCPEWAPMDIHEIETALQNPDFQYRLKAISALKDQPPDIAVPILRGSLNDPEFLVRTFVARGLGSQRTSESFAALLQMIKLDNTPNVRAEAANSLSLFGQVSAASLVAAFFQDDHWLVQRSILGALTEMDCPAELWEVCIHGISCDDMTVQESAVDALGSLAQTSQHAAVLTQLLTLVTHPNDRMRQRVAYALQHFEEPAAKAALHQLREDGSHQVVGAALEDLLPES